MIISSLKSLKKMPIIHSQSNEKQQVSDVFFDRDTLELTYVTFEEETPGNASHSAGQTTHESEVTYFPLTAGTKSNLNGMGLPAMGGSVVEPPQPKQTYFIKADDLTITDEAITYKSNATESDPTAHSNNISSIYVMDHHIETDSDQSLGKVKDILLDVNDLKVVGFKLSEGLWEKIIGEGVKYWPVSGVIDWMSDPIIVDHQLTDGQE